MTINEIIMQLVLLEEHPAMPKGFQPTFQKVIEAISEMPEIIRCKDCRKHNITAAKAESIAEMCPLTTIRGKAKGHEFDYQYCPYGKLRGDSDEND